MGGLLVLLLIVCFVVVVGSLLFTVVGFLSFSLVFFFIFFFISFLIFSQRFKLIYAIDYTLSTAYMLSLLRSLSYIYYDQHVYSRYTLSIDFLRFINSPRFLRFFYTCYHINIILIKKLIASTHISSVILFKIFLYIIYLVLNFLICTDPFYFAK